MNRVNYYRNIERVSGGVCSVAIFGALHQTYKLYTLPKLDNSVPFSDYLGQVAAKDKTFNKVMLFSFIASISALLLQHCIHQKKAAQRIEDSDDVEI